MECKNFPPCHDFQDECMCFTDENSTDPANDQFCGYIGVDGKTVHMCAPNCCNGGLGCPGQCKGTPAKRPQAVRNTNAAVTYPQDKERPIVLKNIFIMLIFLLIVSTFSLFLRA